MGLEPKIPKNPRKSFLLKACSYCGQSHGPDQYFRTNSIFYKDGYAPICKNCLKELLIKNEYEWDFVDRVCQYLDIPFVPSEFERLHELNGENVFPVYAEVFLTDNYEALGWKEYFKEFSQLKETGAIEDDLPLISEEKMRQLRLKYGANYDEEALFYLDSLHEGLMKTQNVNGALQLDQALKLAKISYEIDCRIREGEDFDKLLKSYDALVKIAEFTPKNVKNANEFESVGELCRWLEKRGYVNKFYDNVTRDVVDETLKNIQSYNQRLYTNESGIGDEINKRIESLKSVQELENYYNVGDGEYDLDEFEADGFKDLADNEEFSLDLNREEEN